MTVSRLTAALDAGLVSLPDAGEIAVFRPTDVQALSELPRERTVVVTGNATMDAAARAEGFRTARQAPAEAAFALVVLPREKELARATIAEAARAVAGRGVLAVDGQKTGGIQSIHTAMRREAPIEGTLAKAHGRLFWLRPAPGAFASWAAGPPREVAGGFVTAPGLFSADGPDPGSVQLAEALPPAMGPRVADLGAGWGFLAAAVLAREGVREVHLVEVEADALDCARRNISDPRARFHWADATAFAAAEPFDAVVANPPFHTARGADVGLGRAFIEAAAALLAPRGALWMVANRHLPYEQTLETFFESHSEIGGASGFKLLHAERPRRARRGQSARRAG